MVKNKRIKTILLVAIMILASTILPIYSASATSDIEVLKKRAALNILRECYSKGSKGETGGVQSVVYTGIKYSDDETYAGVDSIISDDKIDDTYFVSQQKDGDEPSRATCLEAFSRITTYNPNSQDSAAVESFLDSIGYHQIGKASYGGLDSDGVGIECDHIKYHSDKQPDDERDLGDICYEQYKRKGKQISVRNVLTLLDSNNTDFASFGTVEKDAKDVDKRMFMVTTLKSGVVCDTQEIGVKSQDNWLMDMVGSYSYLGYSKHCDAGGITFTGEDIEVDNSLLPSRYQYEIYSTSFPEDLSFNTMRKNYASEFDGQPTVISFTPQEVYDLYIHYLISIFGVQLKAVATDCDTTPTPNKLFTSAGWCSYPPVSPSGANNRLVAGFKYYDENAIGGLLTEKLGYMDIYNRLYTLVTANDGKIEGVPVGESGGIDDPLPDPEGSVDESDLDPCYDAAGAQGWFLCPVVEGLGNSLKGLYTDTVEGYLRIDRFLLGTASDGNQGSGTYQAWRIFVDMGNVIVVIFFLVVIFSQLTGVGIDNYGIKKALPKIIIAAILINASFLVSQVVADLSNIIGNALNEMLSGIGDNIARNATGLGDAVNISGGGHFKFLLELTMFTAGGLAAASFINTGLNESWFNAVTSMIIPLVIALLVALIAVLFFFMMLGIRKAAVIVLITVSPIALACYMLPNTKRLVFDRWFKIFRAMIVIYPVCGLLVGGSGLASSILMSSGLEKNFLFYVTNMLLMVVPFFLIPTLVKGSIGAIGSIAQKAGNAVKGFSQRTGDKASNAYKGSAGYKRRQDFAQKERAKSRANRDIKWSDRKRKINSKLLGDTWLGKRNERAFDAQEASARETLSELDKADKIRDLHKNESWRKGALSNNALEAQKEKLDSDNLGRGDFFASKKYLQEQAAEDDYQKTSRFSKREDGALTEKAVMARKALEGRMANERDLEARMEEVNSSEDSLAAGLAANRQKAVQKRKENAAAALIQGDLKVKKADGSELKVIAGDQDNMKEALSELLHGLPKASNDNERAEIEASISVIQDEMMKGNAGRDNIAEIYESCVDKVTGNVNDYIRTAAANFMSAHGSTIEGYNLGFYKLMNDLKVSNKQVGSVDSYMLGSIEKLSAANLTSYDGTYLENVVKLVKDISAKSKRTDIEQKALEQFTDLYSNYIKKENERHQNGEVNKIMAKFVERTSHPGGVPGDWGNGADGYGD